jgi:predicted XRE-type DNA-binding protein
LFIGTRKDNNEDRTQKGRVPDHHGENNPSAKLTRQIIDRVFEMRAQGMTQQKIADDLGVTQPHISSILLGKVWK